MPSCAIKNCKNTSTKKRKLSFFSFPKAPEMIEKWRAVCKENVNPKNGRVCSEHFHSSQYEDRNWLKDLVGVNGNVRIRLKSDAVPEITNDNTEIETLMSVAVQWDYTTHSDTIVPSLSCTQENLSSVASGVSNPVTATNSENTFKKTSTNQDHDKEIQTMKEKNAELLKKVQSLECQLALRDKRHKKELEQRLTLQSKLHKKKLERKFREMLTPFFTPGQIQLILHPAQRKTRWSSEDIASAISLKSISPKAYQYLRKTKRFPLPAISTLRKWVATFNMDEGLLKDILLIMNAKGTSMSDMERTTVICFDEIFLSNQVEVEKKEERAIGQHKKYQVVVAHGIFKKWKQPIYYAYDTDITKEILYDILIQLFEIGYTVYAMTSDMRQSNQSLWNQLGVGINDGQRTYFKHPCNEEVNVHVFADPPHLFKLLRNHFLDSGLHINNKFITKAPLLRLLKLNSDDLKIAHKLSEIHLNVQGPLRQNVKLATQLISATNAAAIEWCGERGYMENCPQWAETAEFLNLFNAWFDVFNSTCKYGHHAGLNGYGVDIDKQNEILSKVKSTMQTMTVGEQKIMLPFQKGFILSTCSLQRLSSDLLEIFHTPHFEMSYITTNRLNQEVLENMFSYFRAIGAANDRPTALKKKNRKINKRNN